MKKKLFSVAQLMNDTAFLKKVEDAIFTTMPENVNGKVVKVNSIGLCSSMCNEFCESFIINATVNSQTLSFRSAIFRQTGDLIPTATELKAENKGFNWQYDIITKSLVGGYSIDSFCYPEFWLSGVPSSDVQDAINYCKAHSEDEEFIVGDWQQLKNA